MSTFGAVRPLEVERIRSLQALLLRFGVIFVAELGDKSQLMALTFAARYKALPVLLGITIATVLVHAMSVGVGAVVGSSIPTDAISVAAGLAFLGSQRGRCGGQPRCEREGQGGSIRRPSTSKAPEPCSARTFAGSS